MALELRQQLKLTQKLVMTPQLRQAIKLLQLNRLDLTQALQAEIEENPALEVDTTGDGDGDEKDFGLSSTLEPDSTVKEKEVTQPVSQSDAMAETNWEEYANTYETQLGGIRQHLRDPVLLFPGEAPGRRPQPVRLHLRETGAVRLSALAACPRRTR
ncbi:MAG: hypothetical protein P8X39_09825 [Desulfofustis sp.]